MSSRETFHKCVVIRSGVLSLTLHEATSNSHAQRLENACVRLCEQKGTCRPLRIEPERTQAVAPGRGTEECKGIGHAGHVRLGRRATMPVASHLRSGILSFALSP